MRKRPIALFISACLFLYFPIELIYRWQTGMEGLDWVDVLLSIGMPLLLTMGLIRVSRVGWYTLVALISLWGVRDLHDYYASQGMGAWSFFSHILIYVVSLVYFINPRVRRVYFDPRLRWWRTKPRHETHLPFFFNHQGTTHYPILGNLSEGGCFIETTQVLPLMSKIELALPLPIPVNVSVIRTRGEVRWVSDKGPHPGMGVQFTALPHREKKALKTFIRKYL